MSIKKSSIFLTIVLASLLGQAQVLMPAASYRSQGSTGHCWAYAGARFVETSIQDVTGVSFETDIEKDVISYLYYWRLVKRYELKAPLFVEGDRGLIAASSGEGGFPEEYFSLMSEFGMSLVDIQKPGRNPEYTTDTSKRIFPKQSKGFHDYPSFTENESVAAVQEILKKPNLMEAKKFAVEFLQKKGFEFDEKWQTQFDGQRLTRKMWYPKYGQRLLYRMQSDPPVTLQVEKDPAKVNTWSNELYNGFYPVFLTSKETLTKAVLISANKRNVTPIYTTNHAIAVIGVFGNNIMVADSSGVMAWDNVEQKERRSYWQAIVGANVPKSALDQALKSQFLEGSLKFRGYKHATNRIRIKR